MIKIIISTAIQRDIETWKAASQRIIQYIESEKYIVIVPKDQTELFRKASPVQYIIKNDEDYISSEYRKYLAEILASKNEHGSSWFIQQFLKIAAAVEEEANDIVLIWDGDTIPLRKLQFYSSEGHLICYRSSEYHQPYFETTMKLLKIGRIANHSFISQCLPVYSDWVREMLAEIEERSKMPWMEAVCNSITGSGNQFSEYETLGNFMLSRYPEMIDFSPNAWERRGGGVYRKGKKISKCEEFFPSLDYVAVESQDLRRSWLEKIYESIKDSFPNGLKNRIKTLFRFR